MHGQWTVMHLLLCIRLGFKTCFSKTKTKTLRFQEQDQDQDSEVPRPRPRPRLWGSRPRLRPRLWCPRPRPRPRLVKTGLETSRDQDSSLENSKSALYYRLPKEWTWGQKLVFHLPGVHLQIGLSHVNLAQKIFLRPGGARAPPGYVCAMDRQMDEQDRPLWWSSSCWTSSTAFIFHFYLLMDYVTGLFYISNVTSRWSRSN